MSITDTLLRRPLAKVALAAATATALAGGLYGTQAASAGSQEPPSVVRAATLKGDDKRGKIVAAQTPGTDERPAPAPAVERADEPMGDNGAEIVARDTPGIDEQPAPPPAGD